VAESCDVVARARAVFYAGKAVPEGGQYASRYCIMWAMRSDSVFVIGVVWRNGPGGLTSSSLLECSVFASHITLTTFSLQLGVEVVSSWLGGGLVQVVFL
jgi:hypothetical protein